MMSGHLCRISNLSKEKIKQLLTGRNRQNDSYRCGGCSKTFETICVLHYHCMKHSEGGSYYFDHVTNTAYPKYDSKCSYAQVDREKSDDSEPYERTLTAWPRSINDILQRDLCQKPDDYVKICEQSSRAPLNTVVESFTPVNVKNIARDAEGLVTFEMDEKDAHLFDATASVIMDRLSTFGDSWLKMIPELQVIVPNKGVKRKDSLLNQPCVVVEKNIGGTVDKATSETPQIEELKGTRTSTEDDMAGTLKGDIENNVTLLDEIQNPAEANFEDENINEFNTDNINTYEAIDGTVVVSTPDKTNNTSEHDKTEIPDASYNARPTRNRKPNSRLSTHEWETPVANKKIIRTDSACKDKHAKVKEAQNKVSPKAKMSKSGRLKGDSKAETDNNRTSLADITADDPSSAVISASKVLLSLCKGDNQFQGNEDQTEKTQTMTLRKRNISDKDSEIQDKANDVNNSKSNEIKTEDEQFKVIKTANVQVKKRRESNRKVKREDGEADDPKRTDYVCKVCGKVGGKAMMEYHRKAHGTEAAYQCQVCEKKFKTRQCFSAHMRQHGEKKFKCDQCSAAFFRKQYLDTHKRKHTGEVPYVCDLCGSGFMEFYILQRHITNIHKQERNFMCDVCGERFFRADTRDNHRTRHFEPTLKCAFCSKMFKAELDRRKHELTHTGEKQFFCPLCKQGFGQLWPYYGHMLKKHGVSKEEAKDTKIKNPDLVYMRNKNMEYQNEDKRERTHQEPLYTVNKKVTKADRTAEEEEVEDENSGDKFEMEMDGDGVRAEYELINTQAGQLTHAEFAEPERDLYEDVTHHQPMFVDSPDISDGMVLHDGHGLEERNTLILGDGQNVEASNISIVLDDGQAGGHRNLVILSDYTQTDLEDYAKQYSAVDL